MEHHHQPGPTHHPQWKTHEYDKKTKKKTNKDNKDKDKDKDKKDNKDINKNTNASRDPHHPQWKHTSMMQRKKTFGIWHLTEQDSYLHINIYHTNIFGTTHEDQIKEYSYTTQQNGHLKF